MKQPLMRMFEYLGRFRKKQFSFLLLGMIITSLFEALTLALIALMITSLSNIEAIVGSEYAYIILNILDYINVDQTPENILLFLSITVSLFVLIKNIIASVLWYFMARYVFTVQSELGTQLYDNILRAPYKWFLLQSSGNIIQTIDWRYNVGQMLNSVMILLTDACLITAMLVSMAIIEPTITIFIVIYIGMLSLIVYRKIRPIIDRHSAKFLSLKEQAFLDTQLGINGLKDVKIHNKQDASIDSFKKKVIHLSEIAGRQRILPQIPTYVIEVAAFSMLTIIFMTQFIILGKQIIEIIGVLSIVAVTSWKVLPAVNRIIRQAASLRINRPFLMRILDMLDELRQLGFGPTQIKNNKDDNSLKIFNKSFSLANVSFCYANRNQYALKDISLEIIKGESIGIIGSSGSGKSTLVDVIVGLLHINNGTIRIDNSELSEDGWYKWRSMLSYIPQNPYIFNGTLAENIAYTINDEDIDYDQIKYAMERAAIDFTDSLQNGADTEIGENGIQLSGGQKQRVAIARALYSNPEVLILDEATSALDSENEFLIMNTINKLKNELTLIMIAHRITTIESCDKIFWIENGTIRKVGAPSLILGEYESE